MDNEEKMDKSFVEGQMRWANSTRDYVEAVRGGKIPVPEGETMQFHIKKFLLRSITGDDLQAFSFMNDYFVSERTEIQKETALVRLNFEIDQPELPEDVRKKLTKVRGQISAADVTSREGYFKTKDQYRKAIDEIKQIVEKDKSLGMSFLH